MTSFPMDQIIAKHAYDSDGRIIEPKRFFRLFDELNRWVEEHGGEITALSSFGEIRFVDPDMAFAFRLRWM